MKILNTVQIKAQKSTCIAKANKVFKEFIESDFEKYKEKDAKVKSRKFTVIEMTEDATFRGLFKESDAISQGEIVAFCKDFKGELRQDGYATFFLFKHRDGLFVAYVAVVAGGHLYVDVYQFSYGAVWNAGYRHRFVIPQQETENLSPDTLLFSHFFAELKDLIKKYEL